jgi:hypothetical protein
MGVVDVKTRLVTCDYCGKNQHEVENLIAGPGHHAICEECTMLCFRIVIERKMKVQQIPAEACVSWFADQTLAVINGTTAEVAMTPVVKPSSDQGLPP